MAKKTSTKPVGVKLPRGIKVPPVKGYQVNGEIQPPTKTPDIGTTAVIPSNAVRQPPPKRSGKRGIGPALDAAEDFENPVRKTPEPEQEELDIEIPERAPSTIQHGKMAAHFVRYTPDRSKDRNRIVRIDFSLELEEAHKGRLPREVEDAWKDLMRGSIKRIDPNGIGSQVLEVSTAAAEPPDLSIVCAVPKVSITRITQKGEGKERKITRLQMQFLTGFTADVEHFCGVSYDETCWLLVKESQRSFEIDAPE